MGDAEISAEKKRASVVCPMLNSTNYTVWSIQMKVTLRVSKVWEAIDPGTNEAEKNDVATALLFQSIPETLILEVGDQVSPKEIWEAIKSRHLGEESIKEARLQTLMSEFKRLKMYTNMESNGSQSNRDFNGEYRSKGRGGRFNNREKEVAESEAKDWKRKFENLAWTFRKLDETGVLRELELESFDENVKLGLELAKIKLPIPKKTESDGMDTLEERSVGENNENDDEDDDVDEIISKEFGPSSIKCLMLTNANYAVWSMRMKIALKVNKEKSKESEKKLLASFEESKVEIASLKVRIDGSDSSEEEDEDDSSVLGDFDIESMKNEMESTKESLAQAHDAAEAPSLKISDLLEEMKSVRNKLKSAIDAETTSKKAMDDLALALKEVATDCSQTKKKLVVAETELEAARLESREWKEKHEEVRKEAELLKNTSERLRNLAEESFLAWKGKESVFVSCIKRGEDEKSSLLDENNRLLEALVAAENLSKKAKEENHKVRDILKQAISEANVAKEAAGMARAENSWGWSWNKVERKSLYESGGFIIGLREFGSKGILRIETEENTRVMSENMENETVHEVEEENEGAGRESDEDDSDEEPQPQLRRSTRASVKPTHLNDYILLAKTECERLVIAINEEPWNFQEYSLFKVWVEVCKEELCSIENNKLWNLVDLLVGVKSIRLKWVFKTKRKTDGSIKHKARLMVKSCPDMKTAFFHGEMKEEVYVAVGSEEKVYKTEEMRSLIVIQDVEKEDFKLKGENVGVSLKKA